jgi:hypothetical protein
MKYKHSRKEQKMKKQVSLGEIAGGALQEQFGKSFARVIENLADPNTSFKEARKITITLKFSQNELRDDVQVDLAVTEKLAAQAPTRTSFSVGKDLRSGVIYAQEYGKQQMSIADLDVNRETGEVFDDEDENRPSGKILDLRRASN